MHEHWVFGSPPVISFSLFAFQYDELVNMEKHLALDRVSSVVCFLLPNLFPSFGFQRSLIDCTRLLVAEHSFTQFAAFLILMSNKSSSLSASLVLYLASLLQKIDMEVVCLVCTHTTLCERFCLHAHHCCRGT